MEFKALTELSDEERTQEACRLIMELENRKPSITRYRITKETKITGATMRYWFRGIWSASPKKLALLRKFYSEVLDGKFKSEQGAFAV